eukprot:3264838-Pyramimonas_sp.AAC.1
MRRPSTPGHFTSRRRALIIPLASRMWMGPFRVNLPEYAYFQGALRIQSGLMSGNSGSSSRTSSGSLVPLGT